MCLVCRWIKHNIVDKGGKSSNHFISSSLAIITNVYQMQRPLSQIT